MSAGYRETALSCPACKETLDPKEVGDAIIDVCPGCAGIWVDWFDGDLVVMVRGAPAVPGARLPERAGSAGCPRCHRPLAGEQYMESKAEILRCEDCAGAFVPRSSVNAILVLDPEHKDTAVPPDALGRLAETLKRWFGWNEGG
jgi:Zn-finger nucleic acid-binding protein